MRKIILISSTHREHGLCNARELLKIIRAIGPEVIFEEIRPSDFDFLYKHLRTLETQAIAKYRESKLFRQIPVDWFDMPASLDDMTPKLIAEMRASFTIRLTMSNKQVQIINRSIKKTTTVFTSTDSDT
jgi:hypothetical protein